MVCKVTADTNRVSLYAAPEDGCWGDAPPTDAALKYKGYEVRMTGESLVHTKQTVTSNVIRTDRMRDTISEVGAGAEGDINFELVFRDLDLFLEAAFADNYSYLIERTIATDNVSAANATQKFIVGGGAIDFDNFVTGADVWVSGFTTQAKANGRFKIGTIGAAGVDMVVDDEAGGLLPTVAASTTGDKTFKTAKGVFTDIEVTANDTITSTTTNFLTGVNLEVGQWIRTEGFATAANNGVFKILAITATTLQLDTTALVVEDPDGDPITLSAKRLKNGTARKSFLIEKKFGDVEEYVAFPGMRVGQMSLSVESQQLVTGTFSFMGKGAVTSATSVLGQAVPAGITPSLNAAANVGSIYENETVLATALRSITLQLQNNLRTKPQLGNKFPVDIGYGFVDVTGTVQAYFEDLVLYNKFIDHDESSLSFRFTDPDGNIFVFTLPRLYYTNGNPNAGGGNDDVLLPLEFTCVRDTDTDAVILLDLIPA